MPKIFVVGDLHGDYESFKNAVEFFDKNKKGGDILIFLGDYADRGPNGVEIISHLYQLLQTRKDIVALKGNHEDYSKNGEPRFYPCDLIDEANAKVSGGWKAFWENTFQNFLVYLEPAYIVGEVLFVHGGISEKIQSREDLFKKENQEILLWSDPYSGEGEIPNSRGAGVEFGEDVTNKVLRKLNLKLIVRSHQPNKASDGEPFFEHSGKVVTINSSIVYGLPFMVLVDPQRAKIEKVISLRNKDKLKAF
jgi:predicted MPP superfamily phosphohydrolase